MNGDGTVGNSWPISGTVVTGLVLVEGVWLVGLTYYTTSRFHEQSERITKLEDEVKINKKRITELKTQLTSNKSIKDTLEDHDERIDNKADKKDIDSIVVRLDDISSKTHMHVSKTQTKASRDRDYVHSKPSKTSKHKRKVVSESSEEDSSTLSSVDAESLNSESEEESGGELDMENMYETLNLDTVHKNKSGVKSKAGGKASSKADGKVKSKNTKFSLGKLEKKTKHR